MSFLKKSISFISSSFICFTAHSANSNIIVMKDNSSVYDIIENKIQSSDIVNSDSTAVYMDRSDKHPKLLQISYIKDNHVKHGFVNESDVQHSERKSNLVLNSEDCLSMPSNTEEMCVYITGVNDYCDQPEACYYQVEYIYKPSDIASNKYHTEIECILNLKSESKNHVQRDINISMKNADELYGTAFFDFTDSFSHTSNHFIDAASCSVNFFTGI